jgi:hypothetical protein
VGFGKSIIASFVVKRWTAMATEYRVRVRFNDVWLTTDETYRKDVAQGVEMGFDGFHGADETEVIEDGD